MSKTRIIAICDAGIERLLIRRGLFRVSSSVDQKRIFSLSTTALLCVLVAFAFIIRLPRSLPAFGLDLSLAQVLVFPFLLLLVFRWKIAELKIPRLIIALGALGASLALIFAYLNPVAGRNTFYTARLQGDDFEVDSRQFRAAVNDALKKEEKYGQARAIRYHASIENTNDAWSVLDRFEGPLAIVWGNKRWLFVTFDKNDAVFFPAKALQPWLQKTGLRTIDAVTQIGISYQPQELTAKFLANLLSSIPASNVEALLTDKDAFAKAEAGLLAAAEQRAGWTLLAHRAFPYWVLGNMYLARGLQNGAYVEEDLSRAENAYQTALTLVRSKDNADLVVASLNNSAIANYIRAKQNKNSEMMRFAQAEMRLALSVLKKSASLHVAGASELRHNATIIKRQSGAKASNKTEKKKNVGKKVAKSAKKRAQAAK